MNEGDCITGGKEVVGRFAPTPSGRMHLGNAFSALMAWLDVRSSGGRMVLRIEDLDPRGQNAERALTLMDDLRWLGLDWDEGPYYQSERGDLYQQALDSLAQRGLIYPCFCTRAQLHAASAPHASDGTYVYQGTCRNLAKREVERLRAVRPPASRLRVPAPDDPRSSVTVYDLIYGSLTENLAADCGDFLVRRSDGVFAYQLAVVVDDALMGVTHVVRGRDLLSSSARQSYLFDLLGHPSPTYAHVPLVVAPDGRRLSKRDGDLDLGALRAHGVSPERVVGRLAYAVGITTRKQDVSAAELVGSFSWDALLRPRSDIVVDSSFLL